MLSKLMLAVVQLRLGLHCVKGDGRDREACIGHGGASSTHPCTVCLSPKDANFVKEALEGTGKKESFPTDRGPDNCTVPSQEESTETESQLSDQLRLRRFKLKQHRRRQRRSYRDTHHKASGPKGHKNIKHVSHRFYLLSVQTDAPAQACLASWWLLKALNLLDPRRCPAEFLHLASLGIIKVA